MNAKVVIDVNVWLSFCIGQLLDDLPHLVALPNVELFTCLELNTEFVEVSARPKLKKYIRKSRVAETLELLESCASLVWIESAKADFADPKDNYLLNLCDTISADYLVTGDTLLLELGQHNETKIIRYRDFCAIFGL
ncbi:MAG: putative toxin-antitoxin system toxin component, PIN family [Saprospiraceae bacterium]|jgi:putative PIN family toxin of toxin-antitoxin system|nr:putative toxin-antitoxin system toxin component, PIN family [Saprospiraceae bacterium]